MLVRTFGYIITEFNPWAVWYGYIQTPETITVRLTNTGYP